VTEVNDVRDVTGASCVFCRVVTGDEAAHMVHDGADGVAFLDRRPLFPGHTLVVPRDHVETLPDLPSEAIGPFFLLVQRLSAAVPAAMNATGSFVAMNNVVSQSVSHLHVHVVPRNRKDGLRGFFWPRQHYAGEGQMAEVAAAISAALAG
jgi:histidine triad (HIT) family protein